MLPPWDSGASHPHRFSCPLKISVDTFHILCNAPFSLFLAGVVSAANTPLLPSLALYSLTKTSGLPSPQARAVGVSGEVCPHPLCMNYMAGTLNSDLTKNSFLQGRLEREHPTPLSRKARSLQPGSRHFCHPWLCRHGLNLPGTGRSSPHQGADSSVWTVTWKSVCLASQQGPQTVSTLLGGLCAGGSQESLRLPHPRAC